LIVVDSSVAIAGAVQWHEFHDVALPALDRADGPLIAHVGLETYSVLTRLPPNQRLTAALAGEYVEQNFRHPAVTLSAAGHERLLTTVARLGITGGAVYDALVAETARETSAKLLTFDRRAVTTYQRLEIDFELLA
jgi:predicted nucleic acid-binding protein